jgi:CRISPR-associated protein Cmr4
VDNSLTREPGTDLPKIPGTSLSGAVRSYAAYRYGKIRCAGQGQPKKEKPDSGHCGQDACPICYTFGYTVGQKSRAGTINIFDAHIMLFPVHSMIGPVWVSTRRRLIEAGFAVNGAEPVETPGQESLVFTRARTEPLNLGWMLLPVSGQAKVTPPRSSDWANPEDWTAIQDRVVLTPETLFSQIVNANLEVRTSVSINPETGAAHSGALFTYEAIPRATFLVLDVVQDEYRTDPEKSWSVTTRSDGGAPLGTTWSKPLDVVESGLKWAAALGVGGMGTRGFGRIALVGSGWSMQSG